MADLGIADAQTMRKSAQNVGIRELYISTVLCEFGGGADSGICLVDLDAETAAEWPHEAGSIIRLFDFDLQVDRATATGELYLGFVKEVDATDGSIYILKQWELGIADINYQKQFLNQPLVCHSDFQKYTSGNYTVLQTDANYPFMANGATVHFAGVGDLVLIHDFETADPTLLTCNILYSVD